MKARRGLTLLELMIASSITLVIATAVGTLLSGTYRLVNTSSSVARASLDLRAERDHLLFHSNHEGGNAYWGGLLSASGLGLSSSSRFVYTATGLDTSGGTPNSRSGQSYSCSDAGLLADCESLDGTNLFAVTLTRKIADNLTFTLSERVVIPAFGREQTHYADGNVFDDWGGAE